MTVTPEGRVKARIKQVLTHYGAYYHMPVQNGMGSPSLDFIACHHGRYLAVEAKAPGKKPTTRQLNTMRKIAAAGGAVFVVDDERGESIANLIGWLDLISEVESSGSDDTDTQAVTEPASPDS